MPATDEMKVWREARRLLPLDRREPGGVPALGWPCSQSFNSGLPLATLPQMLKVLVTTGSPVEQSLLLARLLDAGIPCMRGAGRQRGVLGSGRDVLVEEEDLARAREILNEEDESFDEEDSSASAKKRVHRRRT